MVKRLKDDHTTTIASEILDLCGVSPHPLDRAVAYDAVVEMLDEIRQSDYEAGEERGYEEGRQEARDNYDEGKDEGFHAGYEKAIEDVVPLLTEAPALVGAVLALSQKKKETT